MLTQDILEVIRSEGHEPTGGRGTWQVHYRGVDMTIMGQDAAGRMRLMVPICDASALDNATLTALMRANFSTTLDARYAIYGPRLYAVYPRRMSWLSRGELLEALDQVANLANSFGTTYRSGNLSFGGGQGDS